eukprot:XP_016658750.1 PREDICTED: uncharacterized protein LOC107883379 isoform X1 [Acyrthosiphon pisum]
MTYSCGFDIDMVTTRRTKDKRIHLTRRHCKMMIQSISNKQKKKGSLYNIIYKYILYHGPKTSYFSTTTTDILCPENIRTQNADKQMVSAVDRKTVIANGTSQTKPKRNRVNSIGENTLFIYIILYV